MNEGDNITIGCPCCKKTLTVIMTAHGCLVLDEIEFFNSLSSEERKLLQRCALFSKIPTSKFIEEVMIEFYSEFLGKHSVYNTHEKRLMYAIKIVKTRNT